MHEAYVSTSIKGLLVRSRLQRNCARSNMWEVGSYSMLEMVGTSSWIYLEISWLSLLLQLIELIKLVLSLV